MPMGATNPEAPLSCSQCGQHDTVTVKYVCTDCNTEETLPPKPDGHPAARPCPGPGTDCGGTQNGTIVSCTRCLSAPPRGARL